MNDSVAQVRFKKKKTTFGTHTNCYVLFLLLLADPRIILIVETEPFTIDWGRNPDSLVNPRSLYNHSLMTP